VHQINIDNVLCADGPILQGRAVHDLFCSWQALDRPIGTSLRHIMLVCSIIDALVCVLIWLLQ
jgi:hypothetical protein